ncbi:hypothetical protein RIF29_39368 [Crotalaria pallida]|uniref:Uncharacterized protein n=1 Tax=Crotalaria pallida TaxID=3830 RepID=A0AAN9HPJ7_CROPI
MWFLFLFFFSLLLLLLVREVGVYVLHVILNLIIKNEICWFVNYGCELCDFKHGDFKNGDFEFCFDSDFV